MAVSNQDIINFLLANPGMSDADIGAAMAQYGVSPAQMAQATGLSEGEVTSRLAAVGMFAPEPKVTRVIPTSRGTVIEGDNIDQQIAGIPQVVYETKVDPNNPANWQTVNPKTGEVIASGTFAGGGDRGLLAAAAPVIGLAASTVGLPGITGLLGGLTGATGSTLAGLTGATIAGGTNALAGGTTQDILKAALLGGAGAYGGNLLSNMDVPVDFNNMTADQIDEALQSNLVKDLKNAGVTNPSEFLTGQGGNAATYIQESVAASDLANNLANQGLNSGEIAQLLESVGVAPTAIADALDNLPLNASTGGLLSSVATTPITDAVNVTGQAPTTVPTAVIPSAVTTPTTSAGTVNVTGTAQPQQIDQSVINLINSQLATNVTTPANLANVEITGNRGMMSGDTSVTDIISLLAGATPPPTAPTTRTPTVNVVGEKPKEPTIIDKLIIEPKPPVEPTQKPVIEPKPPLDEVVIKGEKPTITIEDILGVLTNTVAPTTSTPTVNVVGQRPIEPTIIDKPIIEPKPPVDEVVIKDNKPTITIEDILSVLTNTIVPTTPTTAPTTRTPTVNVVGERPTEPTIIDKPIIEPKPPVEPPQKPIIEPKPPIDEVVIKDNKPTITIEDILGVLTNTLPTPPTTPPEVVIKDQKPVPPLLPPIIVEPPQKPIIEPLRPVEPTIIDKPIIEPKVPEIVIKPTIDTVLPTTVLPVLPTKLPVDEVVIKDTKPVVPPVVPTVLPPVEPTIVDKPIIEPKPPVEPVVEDKPIVEPLGLTDAQLLNILKAGLGLFGSVAATTGGTSNRYNAFPTQGVPMYSPEYFNQVQQNYNRLLPAVPRDVSSPLQDWYNSQYGA